VPLLAQVLNATGHERYGMHHNFIQLAVMPIAFVTGAYLGGINGMVIAWITVHPFLAARISRYALRIIHLPVRDYFRDALAPSLVGCALMAVTVTLTRFLVAGLPPYGRLGVEIGVGAATYLGVLFALYRNRITGMQAFARQILGSR
jgi:ABC-type glucose/galactose transport system permease subunit